ncbi:glycosyltransferase [Streptomyces xiangluensis]|uniref:Glycosyltransferase n=1 Tax=Streptomyces xiangluensis TaxID=2665720 RepID=A0ABV8Z8Q7_9ACTN
MRENGFEVTRAHCYGCFVCRRFPDNSEHGQHRVLEAGRGQLQDGAPVHGLSAWFGTWLKAVHARMDALDIRVQLGAARLRSSVRRRGRPVLIVTDRGPLDSLAKFDPPEGSRTAALFRRLADRYDVTLLLDPHSGSGTPSESLSEHPSDQTGRYEWEGRYRRWTRSITRVVTFAAPKNTPASAEMALRFVRERVAARNPHPDQPPARRHVVISIFDDAGNQAYRGGGAVVIDKVARRLSEDFDVTILTAGRRGGAQMRDGVRYRCLPVCWAGPRAGQLLFQAALPFMARRIRHDAWLESFTPPFTTSFLPVFTKAPVIGINQCRGGESTWRKYHIPTFIIEHFGLRFYRDLVVLNEADEVEARRYSPKAAVHLIENGVEQQHVDDSEFGHGKHIVCLGRIDVKMKGLELLLPAYEKAAPTMPLLLLGHGTPTEERKLAALLARTERDIRWLGYTSNERKRQLLEESAFMVMPSRHETFGLVALESMSYGKPVLHFELPWLRWMAGKGNVGVEPFDVERLAAQINRLSEDERTRRDLGRQAYLAAQEYSWEKMTGRYLDLVRQLLTAPESKGRPVSHGR